MPVPYSLCVWVFQGLFEVAQPWSRQLCGSSVLAQQACCDYLCDYVVISRWYVSVIPQHACRATAELLRCEVGDNSAEHCAILNMNP